MIDLQLVKNKLKTLGEAGLNDNNFNDTEHANDQAYQPTNQSDQNQKDILSYFKVRNVFLFN